MKKNILLSIIGIFIASTISVQAYNFTETIRYGTTNSKDVYALQKKLIEKGYLHGTPNGSVYRTTFNAIKKFQKAYGLYPDGIVGPKTRAVLNSVFSQSNNTTVNTNNAINNMPPALQSLTEELWEPLCNGEDSTECVNPTIGFSSLPREGQWLIWAEEGTFDDSIIKTLDVRIANCLDHESCSVSFTYPETHVCRNTETYTTGTCL
jgi:hypothetical protein